MNTAEIIAIIIVLWVPIGILIIGLFVIDKIALKKTKQVDTR
jgi:hypothetical protein